MEDPVAEDLDDEAYEQIKYPERNDTEKRTGCKYLCKVNY